MPAPPHTTPTTPRKPSVPGPAWRDWLVPIAGGALVIVGALFLLSNAAQHPEPSSPAEPAPAEQAAPDVERMLISDNPSSAVGVYQCERAGERVFSDAPCGANGSVREIDVGRMNTYSPPAMDLRPVVIAPAQRTRAPGTQSAAIDGNDRPDQACTAIEEAIESLDARMRKGYTSAEGEIFRRQWHALKDWYHEAGCTWR